MITIHMIGLMYFYREDNGERTVLLPNGTDLNNEAPPHFASFFVQANDLDSDNWWPNYRFEREFELRETINSSRIAKVWEFRIPSKAVITIAGSDQNGAPLITTNLDKDLPKLRSIDSRLDIVRELADTIAEMPIRRGTLGLFAYGGAAAVQLDLDQPIGLAVSARLSSEGGEERGFVLKQTSGATQIVFANTSDLLRPHAHDTPVVAAVAAAMSSSSGGKTESVTDPLTDVITDSHFKLYGKLDSQRRSDGLTPPVRLTPLPQLPHNHDFLRRIVQAPQVPGTGCVPTCC